MPNRLAGLRAAKELLLRVKRTTERAIASTGEIDVAEVANQLEGALSDPRHRRGLILALAEVVAMSVTGSPIDPQQWTPLAEEALTKQQQERQA